ncbi:MAG: dioxygenase [Alphaproteobacteria bacterium]|nr:dioxygenase [Alphaproteobacteria bacterium]
MLPTLFLSHGSPMTAVADSPAHTFMEGLGRRLGRPRAILVASAHWETERASLNAVDVNPTIHDFYGFPPALYALRYPAPGAPELAEQASDLLCAAGLASRVDRRRGLDHGAWVPLLLMYPQADIPVVEISIQSRLGPAHHFQLGRALAPLREQEVLVIGSGSFTHDLSRIDRTGVHGEAADVRDFAGWFDRALTKGRTCDLLTYRTQAPYAAENHPTEEHLLPLYVAMGAAGPGARAERLHSSVQYSVLRMDAYAFH